MTRDEAIKIMEGSGASSHWVDRFIALGMLKLDEPMSAREKFKSEMLALGFCTGSVLQALTAFDEATA